MIVDMVSDLHGFYPKLEGGDLLIVAGDLTARDKFPEYCDTFQWIAGSNYKKKILVAGNHDNLLQTDDWFAKMTIDFEYLCDSGTEFEGLKIWGSPWTRTFKGMNPKCKAFTVDTEEELAEKWTLIPDDVDILVTHSPPHGMLDENTQGKMCGSSTLIERIFKTKTKLHVFGHIHEAHEMHSCSEGSTFFPMIFVNASHVNEHYQPVNKPIRMIL